MIWLFAWRNVWRNKQRSLVVILAVSLGLFGTLFILALSNGLVDQKIDASIYNEISHIQLHHPKFMQDESPRFAITNADSIVSDIRNTNGVMAVSSRLKTTAMASTASTGAGIVLNGINPSEEKKVTDIYKNITEGTYFETESKTNPILISTKTANKLNAKLGSKIVVTIQSMEGHLVYGLFRVRGIYKTANGMFDEMNVFVLASDLAELISFDQSEATEIAVLLDDTDLTNEITGMLKSRYSGLSVLSWKELQPILLALSTMMDQFSILFLIIILIAMAFGIINTMLMAILERIRELGMLRAMGMNNRRIFFMIMLETVFLSMTGGLIGMGISALTIELTGIHGINFTRVAEGFEAMGYSALIYPSLYTSFYFILTLLVIITGVLSSIYPARKALKLKPAEAVRADT